MRGFRFATTVITWAALHAADRPELVLQTGHANTVNAVAISADGKWVFSASNDGLVKMWDTERRAEVRSFGGSSGEISAIAVRPDGERLAWGSADGAVRIAEVATGRTLADLKAHRDAVLSLSFSRTGELLASGGKDGQILLIKHAGSAEQQVGVIAALRGFVSAVAFSPDGRMLATGGGGMVPASFLNLWDIPKASLVFELKGHRGFVSAVAFTPDGSTLASGGDDGRALFWNVSTGALLDGSATHPKWVNAVGFDAAGKRLITAGNDGLSAWSWPRLAKLRTRQTDLLEAKSVAFGPQTTRAIVARGADLEVWDYDSGKELSSFKGIAAIAESLAISPDGEWLVTGGRDFARIWSMKDGSLAGGFRNDLLGASPVLLHSPSRRLFSGTSDGSVTIREFPSGSVLVTVPGNESGTSGVTSFAVANDGSMFAASTRTAVRVRKSSDGSLIREVSFQPAGLAAPLVHISRAGRLVISYANTGVQISDLLTGGGAITLPPEQAADALGFLTDGSILATKDQTGILRFWDPVTGAERKAGTGSIQLGEIAALSARSQLLATGGPEGRIRLLDLTDGSERASFQAHSAWIRSLAWARDDTRIVSTSWDGAMRIWDMSSPSSPSELVTIVPIRNSNGFVAVTPDGLFDGTPGSMRNVNWRFSGNELVDLETFFDQFYTPGLVSSAWYGKPPKADVDLEVALRVAGFKSMLGPGAAILERDGKTRFCLATRPTIPSVKIFATGAAPAGENVFLEDESDSACRFFQELPSGIGARVEARTTSPPPSTIADVRGSTLHVFAVAVDSPGDPFGALKHSESDARELARRFQTNKRTPFAAIRVWEPLTGTAATRAKVLQRLQELSSAAKPEDAVFLFLSGHGFVTTGKTMFYFVTFPYFDDLVDRFAISAADLAHALRRLPAGRVVLAVDACQSGATVDSLAKVAGVKLRTAKPGQSPGVFVIASATPFEAAQQPLTARSAFTAGLLDALDSPSVTAYALCARIRKSVEDAASPTAYPQRTVFVHSGADFPVTGGN